MIRRCVCQGQQVTPGQGPDNPGRCSLGPTRPILLLTRPAAQSARFADECEVEADVIISPILEIVPCEVRVDLGKFGGLIFTSENGVQAGKGHDLAGRKVFAVGRRTAEVARAAGADVTSADGDAEALIALILATRPESPLLHLRGAHARGEIAARLADAGIPTEEQVIYEQVARPLTDEAMAALGGERPVVLPLFSPRSATLLCDALPERTAPLFVVAMSPAVAEAWTGPEPKTMEIAETPDAGAMCRAVARADAAARHLVTR